MTEWLWNGLMLLSSLILLTVVASLDIGGRRSPGTAEYLTHACWSIYITSRSHACTRWSSSMASSDGTSGVIDDGIEEVLGDGPLSFLTLDEDRFARSEPGLRSFLPVGVIGP